MGSSKSNRSRIECLIRKISVEAQPEEIVRQELLKEMVQSLGYPMSCITVEKSLCQLPHLKTKQLPDRRADILCFAKGVHHEYDLYPLLLVECKAIKLTEKVISQVTGYNHFVKAYFVAIASQVEVQTGWYNATLGKYQFVPYLPDYSQLLKSVHSFC